ncbi:MAG: hypothetical protein QOD84_2316 [Acidobacteriaceae bacterium]|jgi:hypothetical protein
MRTKLATIGSTLAVLLCLSLYSVGHPPQNADEARHEPHMSAAYGHLREAKAELERAAPNKGGHRERALELVNQAIHQVEEGERYFDQHERRR